MPPAAPTRLRPQASRAPVWVVAVAIASMVAGLFAGCGGERPSLGDAPPPTSAKVNQPGGASLDPTETSTTTAGSGSGSDGATTTPPPALDPATLLGYIATPTGQPVVHTAPDPTSSGIDVAATTAAGAPTTFAVVGDPTSGAPAWYQVVLPTRPNGATAWVPASSVTLSKTPFRLFVDLEARRLQVERDGAQVLAAPVAIGTTENPTPVGATYVTELIDNASPGGSYGPYAFGLALHSDTLTEFAGGPGQVGIHGTNQPQKIGQRVSHGCIRLNNADIEALVDLGLPLGVPVFITT